MSTPIEILVVGKDGASVPLRSITKELATLGKTATTETAHTSGFFKTLASTAGGFLAANVIGGIGRQFAGFARDAIQESRDAAHGMAQTEAAIKSTGGAAGVTGQQIADMAGSLSHATLFSDDAIQAQENLMLTFTNVKNVAGEGNDIFTQSNKLALDMAQAMGTDAAGGAIQLGKALNDPVAGITALTRVGVTFSDAQKKQIKSMAEHNNVIGAQKIILGELNKEFGGSAAAALAADGGYHQFQQTLADVEQTVGDALRPALTQVMELMSGPVLGAVQDLALAFAGALPGAIDWLTGTAIPAMVAGWQAVVAATKPVLAVLSTLGSYFAAVVGDGDTFNDFLSALPGWLQPIAVVGGDVVNFLMDFGSAIGSVAAALAGGDFSGALTAITGWIGPLQDDLSTLGSDIATWLAPIAQTIADQVLIWGQAFVAWVPTAIADVQAALPGIWNAVSTWIGEQAGPILTQMGVWGSQFIAWVPTAITDIQAALPGIWTAVSTWISDQAAPILTQMEAWGSQFVAWIPTAITDLQNALPGIWTAVSTWITDTATTIGTTLVAWGSAFVDWIGPAIPGFLQAMGAFATGIGTAIATGLPIIAQHVSLWANELVAWIQRDAVPKLEPAFSAFLTTLGAQADRAKTVLSAKGNEAGVALVDGMKLGWANAPVETSNQMIKVAAEIDKNRPLIIIAMKVLGEVGVKSLVDSMSSQTTIQLPSIATQITVALLGFIPALGIAAGKLGLSIAESWYKGAYDQFQKLFPGLNALGASMGKFLADGLNTAGALIVSAARQIGSAIIDGIRSGISAGVGALTGAVTAAAHGALNAAKASLGIHSPSMVFRDEIGLPIIQGIAAGIQAGAANMTATATGAVQGAIDAARGVLTGATFPNPFASLNGLATYSGATNPLSYLTPAMRELPTWVGYVKDLGDGLRLLGPRTDWMAGAAQNAQDLGDGLRLLGDQTPAVQDLGNGLTLLGDQWARQAATMTDLAPALPQLADGYTQVAVAAKDAAAATVRATNDILDHVKLLGGASLDGMGGFTGGGGGGGGPLSFLNSAGGLGGSADYAKKAGSDAGMGFGDGWQQGIEQIAPAMQTITATTLQQLQEVVLLPWQTMTNDFFSGAGFGFIGQASIGINSAGNGLATSAGNVGGAAGAALVGALRSNLAGVTGAISDINAAIANTLKTDYTVTIHVARDGGTTTGFNLPHFAAGVQNFGGGLALVGERGPEVVALPRGSNVYPTGTPTPRGGDTNITIQVDARGSSLSASQIEQASYKGTQRAMTEAGRSADVRMRTA